MSVAVASRDGDATRILLNRPESLNAFDADLVAALTDAVAEAGRDGTRLLVFRGAGRGFSGGFDLRGLDGASDGDLLLRFVRIEELLQSVHAAPCATLALVHGPCYGAGADLAAACDWRIGAPDARFWMPGYRFGLILGTGRLGRIVGADAARSLLLRDRPFDAAEARETGFLTGMSAPDGWPAAEAEILGRVASAEASALRALSGRLRTDARDADLAALVRSAAKGSLRRRLQAYRETVGAAKRGR